MYPSFSLAVIGDAFQTFQSNGALANFAASSNVEYFFENESARECRTGYFQKRAEKKERRSGRIEQRVPCPVVHWPGWTGLQIPRGGRVGGAFKVTLTHETWRDATEKSGEKTEDDRRDH